MATLAYTAILAPVIGNILSSLLGSKTTNKTVDPRPYQPKKATWAKPGKKAKRRGLNYKAKYQHPWPTGIKSISDGKKVYKRLL